MTSAAEPLTGSPISKADEEAFLVFHANNQTVPYRWAKHFLRRHADVEDVEQETWAQLWALWLTGARPHSPALLKHVAACRAKDQLKLNSHREQHNIVTPVLPARADPFDTAQAVENRDLLRRLLVAVPSEDQLIVYMRAAWDMPLSAIASYFGVAPRTIRRRHDQAMTKMRAAARDTMRSVAPVFLALRRCLAGIRRASMALPGAMAWGVFVATVMVLPEGGAVLTDRTAPSIADAVLPNREDAQALALVAAVVQHVVNRGTETLPRLVAKLGGYVELAWLLGEPPWTLFAFTSPRRETNARLALADSPVPVATASDLDDPAGPIWLPVHHDPAARVRLGHLTTRTTPGPAVRPLLDALAEPGSRAARGRLSRAEAAGGPPPRPDDPDGRGALRYGYV